MFPPACGTVAGAVLVIDTSVVAATPACVVVSVVLLLPALSSGVPVIDAVFENVLVLVVVLAGTETTIDTVADERSEERRVGKECSVAVAVHVPCDAVEETNVTPAGRVSVTVPWEA